jgi:hypothetical protein
MVCPELYNGNVPTWTTQNSKADGMLDNAWTQNFTYDTTHTMFTEM